MAKKGSRILIGLICEICRSQNYLSQKNKLNTHNPLKIKKYCSFCKKRTIHKETKSLD